MFTHALRSLDQTLAYLAWLTRNGLKPLSRWEGAFASETIGALRRLGLHPAVVERRTCSGRPVRELLFARSPDPIQSYSARFDNTRLDPTPENVRLEGRLFGYPACCVESYAAHGYLPNSLQRADQRLLFHWACPGCAATPLLLPRYRAAFRDCRRARRATQAGAITSAAGRFASGDRNATMARLTVAAILATSSALTGRATSEADPHVQPLPNWEDGDGDGLANVEEQALGTAESQADENGNAIPDGTDLARLLAATLANLPTKSGRAEPYVIHHLAFGSENCAVCGAPVNMGTTEVINPLENQAVHVPYIAQHFLEHGSFSYTGSVHAGRINPPRLKLALTSRGRGHLLPDPADRDWDQDGLLDGEEPSFQCHPAVPDSDGDFVWDGVAAARALRAQLDTLPRAPSETAGPTDRSFVVEHPMDGFELCPRCGDRVVMDLWVVVNPRLGIQIAIPSMALHHLKHGAFRWEGGQLAGGKGRVDPRQLRAAIGATSEAHQFRVSPDTDGDLLSDAEEQSLGTSPQRPDMDGNGLMDGVDLARSLAGEIAALPNQPAHDRPYKEEQLLRGLETCDVCGATVNMGWLVVVNPRAGLYAKAPYIAMHYLEHGGFSYAGDVHGADRAEVALLVAALRCQGPTHFKPAAGDSDGDGLKDEEEAYFHTDPQNADTDGDGVPDGFHLARDQWRAVQALPRTPGATTYAVDHPLRGLVTCDVCGQSVNMGAVEIVGPRDQPTLEIPYLSLHFMEHGTFAPSFGPRVDPVHLDALLRLALVITQEQEQVVLRWRGQAGQKYRVEIANEVGGPWNLGPVFFGTGQELSYTEPMVRAKPLRFYRITAD